jgi:hypothetical protein
MFENESEAQRQNREAIADENARYAAELRDRADLRNEVAAAARKAARLAEVQQRGKLLVQQLRETRSYLKPLQEKLQSLQEAEKREEQTLAQLVSEGFIDELTPLIEKQEAEKKAREAIDTARREAFKASLTPKPVELTKEQIEANESAVRAREEFARTHRTCPQCRTEVALTADGEIPEQHTFMRRDPQSSLTETLTCHPYGTEPRNRSARRFPKDPLV